MPSLWIVVPLLVAASAVWMLVGLWVGFNFMVLREQYKRLDEWHRDAEDTSSAVVDTTPNLLREKERRGELETDESQIVTVKSPRQLKADKDRQLERDIDRVTGMGNRS